MDTNDQSGTRAEAQSEAAEQTIAAPYKEAVLTADFHGIKAGTAIRIYPAEKDSGYSTVTTEDRHVFKFCPATFDAESQAMVSEARILTGHGKEFTVSEHTLPVTAGKKFVLPRLEDSGLDIPDHLRPELKAGHIIILEPQDKAGNAVQAKTLTGVQFMITGEIAALLSKPKQAA